MVSADSMTACAPQPPLPDEGQVELRTDLALIEALKAAVAKHLPAEVLHSQRLSFARGFSGLTDDQLRAAVPELFHVDDALQRATRAEAERDAARAEVVRLWEAAVNLCDEIETLMDNRSIEVRRMMMADQSRHIMTLGTAVTEARAALSPSEPQPATEGDRG